MLLAAALATALSGCVPVHWFAGEPKSLRLLDGTAAACVLVEERYWSQPFVSALPRGGHVALQLVSSP